MIRCTRVVAGLLALGMLPACSSDRATGINGLCDVTNPVSSITVKPSSATLYLRSPPRESDSIQLEPTAFGRFGAARTDIQFSYVSSNSAVAAVTDSGLVTPQAIGSATITVSACDEEATVGITVASDIGAITVTLASDTIVVGDSVLVSAQAAAPGGGVLTGVVFSWSANPSTVASVTPVGDTLATVHALSEGTAVVSASTGASTGSASLVVVPATAP